MTDFELQVGDEVFGFGGGFVSNMVSWFTKDDPHGTPSHIGIGYKDGQVAEARRRVRLVGFEWFLNKYRRVEVYRHQALSNDMLRGDLIQQIRGRLGTRYSYRRIGRQLLDEIFNTNYWTKSLEADGLICSQFVSLVMSAVNVHAANVPSISVNPDEMYDFAREFDFLKRVFRKEG